MHSARIIICLLFSLLPPLAYAAEPEIEIEGADDTLLDNLRVSLSLSSESCETPSWKIRRLFEESDRELTDAARALGYYHIRIEKQLKLADSCWQAHYSVTPGEPLRITQSTLAIEGEGGEDPDFTRLITESPVKPGAIVHHGEYEGLKREIEIIAAEKGFFDGRFLETRLQVDIAAATCDVKIIYDTGKRYRVGQLTLHQEVLDDRLFERHITIQPGDHYDNQKLVTLQRALSDSGYFSSVSVRPDLKQADQGIVNIDVYLTPSKRSAYQLGLGAATDTGPRMVLGYERRRINRRGHRLEAKAKLATEDGEISADYIIPLTLPNQYQLGFRGGYRYQETDAASTRTSSLGASLLGNRFGWRETAAIDWVNEEYTLAGETAESSLLVPSLTWSRKIADDPIRTNRGYRLNLNLRGGLSSLLSDVNFLQATVDGKWIFPLASGRVITRAEIGATAVDSFDKLPASYRFFAGGDQSVRGYDYQALGTRNSEGEVIGGHYLLTSSLEYEHPISDEWGIAIFADAGHAFDEFDDSIKTALGTGIRWHSPVGPIRIDLAVPFNNPDDEFRIHFSMGPDL